MTQNFIDGDFFVMLNTQHKGYTPLMNLDNDDIAKFKSKDDARKCANENLLGNNFGYEIFEIGCGIGK